MHSAGRPPVASIDMEMSLFHKFASRRDFLKAGGAITLVSAGLLPARAAPDRSRIALVVGNNSYPRAPLNNAINDAKAVGALLERAGFDVTLKTDVGRDALREAAKEFGAMARGSEAREVFFYYAGHGAQMNWRNFLIPVDERIETATDLPAQCLEFGGLLSDLSKAKGKVFVLILDACRDNPFGTGFQPAQKGLSQLTRQQVACSPFRHRQAASRSTARPRIGPGSMGFTPGTSSASFRSKARAWKTR
jgi:Caspase domain